MRPDPHQDADTAASPAAGGAAAAFHSIHAAPMQGMGYAQPSGLAGVLDDFAHRVSILFDEVPDPERPLLLKDPVPAWKQRIPDPDPFARAEATPDAKTRARLRAKRKR